MKRTILALSLVILFLIPVSLGTLNTNVIERHIIQEQTLATDSPYEEDFSVVTDWVVTGMGSGSISTDGNEANFSLPASNFDNNFYTVISTSNFQYFFYEFNVTSEDNIDGSFRIYSGVTYYEICTVTSSGVHNGSFTIAASASVKRLSFLLWMENPLYDAFMVVDYLEVYPVGITGFNETLDDDVLYSNDAWETSTFDYDSATTVGCSLYTGSYDSINDTSTLVRTTIISSTQDGFHYTFSSEYENVKSVSFYVKGTSALYCWFYNYTLGALDEATTDTSSWVNKTFSTYKDINDFVDSGEVQIRISESFTGGNVELYYLEVVFVYVTGSYWCEPFNYVSDWSALGGSGVGGGEYSLTSNGDRADLSVTCNDAGNEYYAFQSDIPNIDLSSGEIYIQWYAAVSSNCYGFFTLYYTDTTTQALASISSTSYNTYRARLTATTKTIDKIYMYVNDNPDSYSSGNIHLYVDYLRIFAGNESGWQHDCSTISSTSNDAESGFTYSTITDGDILSCNITRTSGSGATFVETRFIYDYTTTQSDVESTYYPFFKVRVQINRSSSASEIVYVDSFSDSLWVQENTTVSELSDWTTIYLNQVAGSVTATRYVRIGGYLDAVDDWIQINVDYVKRYNINRFSVTQTGCTKDDVLYVSDSILYSDITSGSVTLDYELPLLQSGIYTCNKSSSGTSYLSFDIGYWTSYYDETEIDFVRKDLADIKIKFNATSSIGNILFYETPPKWHSMTSIVVYFDMPEWHEMTPIEVQIYVPIDQEKLEAWFMLLGLIMIPTSTTILAIGAKTRRINRDILLVALIIFVIGWGLFLGGIM